MGKLSTEQVRAFRDNGFLTISGFFEDHELDAAAGALSDVWRDMPPDLTVDSLVSGRRVRIKDLLDSERQQPFKVNDLFLRDAPLREAVISERLGEILRQLFDEDPVVINTLSVDYGTQQPDHLDTLYMTPHTPGRLMASWMALEDVDSEAGPLRFYPESNHIEPYRFQDGSFHARGEEMSQWADYMAGAVDRHGVAEERFLAKRGDLFIWDAWLLHGGSEICTPGLTRKSLITHYHTYGDCLGAGVPIEEAPGGYWLNRSPHALVDPDAAIRTDSTSDDEGGNRVTAGVVPPSETSLHDRLDSLTAEHH